MSQLPIKVSKSGIKYFLEENHTFPSVSFGVFVKSGSRYERESELGIAHFIEHMVFKETKNRSSYEISHSIESLGGEINAFTSPEYSLFYVKLLSKDIRKGIEIISDIIKNPTFNEELLEKEREVILEEISEYYDDPQDICQTEAARSVWGDDPASFNPLGKEKTVKKIKKRDLLNYFDRFFNLKNIFISAVGDINDEQLEKMIEEFFSGFNDKDFSPEVKTPDYKFNEIKIEKETAQIHLAITMKGSGFLSEEHLINSIFTTVVGGNMSSRLFQHLREERGLAYTVYSYPIRLTDTGANIIYASTTPSKLKEVSDLICKEIELIKKEGITKSEFDDAKKYIIGSVILGLESMTNRMQRNGVQGLFLGRIETVQTLMDKLEKIDFGRFTSYVSKLLNSEMGKVIVGKKV